MGQPRYEGVGGSPQEVAVLNRRISQARSLLSQISRVYGRDEAEALLWSANPDVAELATLYPPLDPDELWFQEQDAMTRFGAQPFGAGGFSIPDYGTGAPQGTMIPGLTDGSLQQMPPSMRRFFGG